jgi:outer membrane murein-binding lipoprotein Lpp
VSPAPTYNAPTIGAYNTAQVQALAAQVATLTQSVNALTAQLRATGVNA